MTPSRALDHKEKPQRGVTMRKFLSRTTGGNVLSPNPWSQTLSDRMSKPQTPRESTFQQQRIAPPPPSHAGVPTSQQEDWKLADGVLVGQNTQLNWKWIGGGEFSGRLESSRSCLAQGTFLFQIMDGTVVGLGELSAGGRGLGWGWDLGHSLHERDFWHLSYKCIMSSP